MEIDPIVWMITIVIVCGAIGGFANVFIGDPGLHLPKVENDIFQPGFLGVVFVGAVAALGSWGAAKAIPIFGKIATDALNFSTGDIANALIVGFGGSKWFKSETEKDVLQKTAVIAASKPANANSANTIAYSTPLSALRAAVAMPEH